MDIGFSEEQELLRETARKFLEAGCDSRFVRERMATAEAVTETFWRQLAEQGWLGIVYPEDDGGSGLGLVDLVVLMEEMGRRVMPGPFFSTVLLGGAAIAEAGSPAQRREWLPRIAAGDAKAALAWTEPALRWDAAGIALPAREAGDGLHSIRQQTLCRRRPSRRHPDRRGAHPRRQHDGGRRQSVSGSEGYSGSLRHLDADDRRDPKIVRSAARQCHLAGLGLAR